MQSLRTTAWRPGWKIREQCPRQSLAVDGLAENLRLQDRAAQRMKKFRHIHGALSLETIEAKPVFDGDQIRSLEIEEKNRAKEIIEDFMIAANGVTARYLSANKFPSIRRVVRIPKRWDRIVEIAAEHKFRLPEMPDSKALEEFLVSEKAADPIRFPDLSLAVIKLLGFWRIRRRNPWTEMRRATLVWQSRTMVTPPLRIAAILT